MPDRSICLFHNGNKRVIEYYKRKFSNLTFSGNWSEDISPDPVGKLWEICHADATFENLLRAQHQGIYILRHVSTFENDLENLITECTITDYNSWINNIVSNYLIMADEIVSELIFPAPLYPKQVIITTGRTASKHFQSFLLDNFQVKTFECTKTIDKLFLDSQSAVLLWREDQWETITSTWIGHQINSWIHSIDQSLNFDLPTQIREIDSGWTETHWFNLCNTIVNNALFYKSVLKRPISLITTERAVTEFQSVQNKIPYDKSKIIKNHQASKEQYLKSDTYKKINFLYNRIKKIIPNWNHNFENYSI